MDTARVPCYGGSCGGGLALGLTLSPNRLKMSDAVAGNDEALLNTWVKIGTDNVVTVYYPHAEMGQGAGTGLAQMLAEELDAGWDLVRIEQAPVTDTYTNSDLGRGYVVGEGARIPAFAYPMLDFAFLQIAKGLVGQLTGGSTAIRLTGHHGMRRAGAAAQDAASVCGCRMGRTGRQPDHAGEHRSARRLGAQHNLRSGGHSGGAIYAQSKACAEAQRRLQHRRHVEAAFGSA